MCLNPKYSTLFTAKQDIEVAKIVRIVGGKITSAYVNSHSWEVGKVVIVATRLGGNRSKKDVFKGLHACVDIKEAKRRRSGLWTPESYKIYRAIIPKGSIYKLGYDGDIIANQMKLVGSWFAKKK